LDKKDGFSVNKSVEIQFVDLKTYP